MRVYISAMFIGAFAVMAVADSFIFSKDGKIISGPRDLPSVGVRLDDGKPVLGLHGASDAVKAACGWFRVIPSTQKAPTNQVVASASYTIGKDTAQEVLAFGVVETFTAQQRLAFAFEEIKGANDDERVSAFVQAVASVVTNKIKGAVTVTIPAAKESVK